MADTIEEAKAIIVRKLLRDSLRSVTWSDITTSIQTEATPEERTEIALSLQQSKLANVGKIISNIINRYKESLAITETDNILADNSISIDELLKIL
jgi:hypothetical protein